MPNSNHEFNDYDNNEIIEAGPKSIKRKIAPVLAFLLLLVGGTYLVQTTLAANIALNTGSPIEFGQGVTTTSACSGATNLTITPNSTFTNASGAGAHYFSSVKVSNIPSGCYGKDFTINAYGNTDATPLALFNSTSKSAVVYNNSGTFELGAGSVSGASITSGSGTFTVTFTNPVATSGSVFKITLQSGAHTVLTCATGGTCIFGNTGPGGGKVFYVAGSPFACGPTGAATCNYLEVATTSFQAEFCDAANTVGDVGSTRLATLNPDTIGAGYASTLVITAQCSGGAAVDARAYRGGSLNDWYLHNRQELQEIYANRVALGVDITEYWQSISNSATRFGYQNFSDGYRFNDGTKYDVKQFRPIRAF
jgi:hypothetical protein